MIKRVYSCGCYGLRPFLIHAEVDVRRGVPDFDVLGGAGCYEREAAKRVRIAMKNGNYDFPKTHITVNLAPADMPKNCSAIDLALAVGIYAHMYEVPEDRLESFVLIGELSLDGRIKSCRNAISMVEYCLRETNKHIVIPGENARETYLMACERLHYANTLSEALGCVVNGIESEPKQEIKTEIVENKALDYRDIYGNQEAKNAMMVAAAGRHHSLLIGSPGCGKTMVAERLPTIMPPMSIEEMFETTGIYSAAGKLDLQGGWISSRPVVKVSSNATPSAMTGGGRVPKPGAISLAHNGILFVDEAIQLSPECLDTLREPLEQGTVNISRQNTRVIFPAGCLCVMAANPCKCGKLLDDPNLCTCSPRERGLYMKKLSGPLMDRIDLHVKMTTQPPEKMREGYSMSSQEMREKVILACNKQEKRFGTRNRFNSQMTPGEVNQHCILESETSRLYDMAVSKYGLSNRAYFRMLRVARTLADLDDCENIGTGHILGALSYRGINING